MHPAPDGLERLKHGMRRTWMTGDFGQLAHYSERCAEEFVDRLNIQPGMRVLDVACGTGNLAIPAARKSARVWGVDFADNLVAQAIQRAKAENLPANFEEGDAEQLPYPDSQFDVVMSMFGAMFPPRPEMVAQEMARVCRPGGRVAMASWTPGGFIGQVFVIGARYIAPPEGIPAPVLWGVEDVARERFGQYAAEIRTTRRMAEFDFPFPPPDVVAFFREYFGPAKVAFSRLDAEGQAAYAADLEKLWRERNEAAGTRTLVHAEYLEVVAVRR